MKKCFIDVETTGLDPEKNGLIQVAGIIEVPDLKAGGSYQLVKTFSFSVKPFRGDLISKEALVINKLTTDDLEKFEEPIKIYGALTNLFSTFVDKFNKKDKMFFIGYNAGFDYNFMRKFWDKCGDKYFGSFFWFPYVDVMTLAMHRGMEIREEMPNFKLATVAKKFGLEVDEARQHEALYDISITKKLFEQF